MAIISKYPPCPKCGNSEAPYVLKAGMCRKCYMRAYMARIRQSGKLKQYRAKRLSFSSKFTKHRSTLRKLVFVAIHRLFPRKTKPLVQQIERAKTFIRNHLCHTCRVRYINQWNNDFDKMSSVLCDKCEVAIFKAIDRRIELKESKKLIRIKKWYYKRFLAIAYELEFRFDKPIKKILIQWHRKEKKSSYEIFEILRDTYHFYDITDRAVRNWLYKFDILRTHVESLRMRVVTKRMDYNKRKIDYKNRKINYRRIARRKKAGLSQKAKISPIHVSSHLKNEIKNIAALSHRTMAEVIRDALKYEREILPKRIGEHSREDILNYAIRQHRQDLLRRRLKTKRGRLYSLLVDK